MSLIFSNRQSRESQTTLIRLSVEAVPETVPEELATFGVSAVSAQTSGYKYLPWGEIWFLLFPQIVPTVHLVLAFSAANPIALSLKTFLFREKWPERFPIGLSRRWTR